MKEPQNKAIIKESGQLCTIINTYPCSEILAKAFAKLVVSSNYDSILATKRMIELTPSDYPKVERQTANDTMYLISIDSEEDFRNKYEFVSEADIILK